MKHQTANVPIGDGEYATPATFSLAPVSETEQTITVHRPAHEDLPAGAVLGTLTRAPGTDTWTVHPDDTNYAQSFPSRRKALTWAYHRWADAHRAARTAEIAERARDRDEDRAVKESLTEPDPAHEAEVEVVAPDDEEHLRLHLPDPEFPEKYQDECDACADRAAEFREEDRLKEAAWNRANGYPEDTLPEDRDPEDRLKAEEDAAAAAPGAGDLPIARSRYEVAHNGSTVTLLVDHSGEVRTARDNRLLGHVHLRPAEERGDRPYTGTFRDGQDTAPYKTITGALTALVARDLAEPASAPAEPASAPAEPAGEPRRRRTIMEQIEEVTAFQQDAAVFTPATTSWDPDPHQVERALAAAADDKRSTGGPSLTPFRVYVRRRIKTGDVFVDNLQGDFEVNGYGYVLDGYRRPVGYLAGLRDNNGYGYWRATTHEHYPLTGRPTRKDALRELFRTGPEDQLEILPAIRPVAPSDLAVAAAETRARSTRRTDRTRRFTETDTLGDRRRGREDRRNRRAAEATADFKDALDDYRTALEHLDRAHLLGTSRDVDAAEVELALAADEVSRYAR